MTTPPARRLMMTTDAVGGVWIHATALAMALTERGWSVLLVSMGPAPRRDQLKALTGISRLQVEVTDYALEWMDPAGADVGRAWHGLSRLAARFRADLVHLNGYREACAEWPAPVLVAAHSCVRSWWLACHGAEPAEPRWKTYIRNVEAGLAAADLWVAPSAAFRDTITALYAPPKPGWVIRNGVEAAAAGAPKEPFILAAGRLWDAAKNVAVLGPLAGALPWPIKVAGAVRAEETGADLGSTLDLLGELPHDELLRVMQRAEIFVSPALYEPFGLSVLEAAASGCALVLSDIPTFRELWHGAAAFAGSQDDAALGCALRRLTQDVVWRHGLQRAALDRALRYGFAATLDGHLAAYERLLAGHIAAPPRVPGPAMRAEVRP